MLLSSLILGAATGVALGLSGAGGGILAIPLLTLGAGLTYAEAAPIALVSIATAAGLGAALGLREGIVRYRAAFLIGGTGMAVAPAGVWLAHQTPQPVLTAALALVMLLSAWMVYQRSRGASASGRNASPPCYWSADTGRFVWTRLCATVMAAIGLIVGALSGLLSVGGGFLLVPALTRLTNLRVDAVVSTSQAVIALVSAAGAAAAVLQGDFRWSVAGPFAAAAMAALLGGRTLARRMQPRVVQLCFALLSGGIAAVLLVRTARTWLT